MKQKKILLVTYDISPYKGSEASVSWNYVFSMQHYHKLTVLYGKGKEDRKTHTIKLRNG